MANKEVQTLIETIEFTRDLTKYYLHKLKGIDNHKVFEVEGKRLNSVLWIIAHMAVSENFLLLICTGGERVKIPWARQFGLGSEIPKKKDCPPMEEVLLTLNEVHQQAIKHLNTLSDEQLSTPTTKELSFIGDNTIKNVIKHHIRHEGSHNGQLGWLCKLFDIKTI